MNTSLINGPINVVRLEGKINNIHKVLYIYMDYHFPVNRQLQCDDTAIDIQYHFAEKLKNIDTNIDFFLEIWPSHISTKHAIYRGRYIDEVARYFKKYINHKIIKPKVLKRNESTNNITRFHFIDIRDALESDIYKTLIKLLDILQNCLHNNIFPNTKLLNDLIIKLHDNYNLLYDITFNHVKYDKTHVLIDHYINKITSKYENNTIASVINDKLNTLIKPYFNNIFKLLKNASNVIDQIEKNNISTLHLKFDNIYGIKTYTYGHLSSTTTMTSNLNNIIDEIDHNSLLLFSRYVDVFFLRRFLDKKYITNAITYTGSSHSITYIITLLQDFDFKITHCAYSKINNINKLNKKIKKAKHKYEVEKLLYPPILTQCSDLKKFPMNFN